MLAVEGYYDGTEIRPLEKINVKKNQKVIITITNDFIKPTDKAGKSGMRGALAAYADSTLREREKSAWEYAAVKNYGDT